MKKCQQLEDSPAPSSSFPSFYAPPGYLDTDTPLTKSSFETAKAYCRSFLLPSLCPLLMSCSAAIFAVDHLLTARSSLPPSSAPLSSASTTAGVTTPVKTPPSQWQGKGQPPLDDLEHEQEHDLYSSLSSLQHTPSASAAVPPPVNHLSSPAAHHIASPQTMFVIGRPPGHHAGPNG
jgi:hypothetical protein